MSIHKATVEDVTRLGSEIKSFRLRAPVFSGATPGAHIDVFLPNGLNRQYSLWDWADDGSWGVVGVKNETDGRGGSTWMHENLKPGDVLDIGEVRNNFKLDESQKGHVLIAGGIGVTPMVPMARRLKKLGKPFTFYYLARDAGAAGFTDILEGLGLGDDLKIHLDDRDGIFNLKNVLNGMASDAPVYFCGPEPLLNAVLSATEGWPAARVNYERFVADAAAAEGPSEGFEIVLNKTGDSLFVPEEKSILDTLLDAGHDVEYGCMSGVCGACTSTVAEGEVDHRDATKSAAEHDEDRSICICVSRAKGPKLVLDL